MLSNSFFLCRHPRFFLPCLFPYFDIYIYICTCVESGHVGFFLLWSYCRLPQATGTVSFNSVTCAVDSACGMAIDDSAFDVTGENLDCEVCDLDGEELEVTPSGIDDGGR